jgi:sporulation protein YabP
MKRRLAMEEKNHNISLENRNSLSVSGVKDIYNFDETKVVLDTNLGTLTIAGEGLQINKLNIEDGNLQVKGSIISCVYSESRELRERGKGILGRMFK